MILLPLLLSLPTVLADDYCLATDQDPYLMFGDQTSYEFVYGKDTDPYVPNCHPVQFWFITRHGARFPHDEQTKRFSHMDNLRDQIVGNHDERRNGELCREDLENLRSWEMSYHLDESSKLVDQGYSDMLFLGRRLRTTFRDLLDATYTPDRFIFKYAQTERSEESAKALAEGIFGRGVVDISPDEEDNYFLAPEKNCSYWTEKDTNRDRTEENKFKKSDVARELVARVSRRLGFLYNLTFESLLDMWGLCRFDKSLNYAIISPWCAAFDPEDLKIMEYYEDLVYYYSLGYGQEVIFKMGCPILKDMIERFSALTKNTTDLNSAPKGVFYTVHKTILTALLVRLGIGKPVKPLTSANFPEMSRRPWRISRLVPFSGNLAAVLYKCNNDQFNVMFFGNEKLLNYDGCRVGLCEWKPFYSKFRRIVDSSACSYKFCETGTAPSTKTYLWLLSFVVALWRIAPWSL